MIRAPKTATVEVTVTRSKAATEIVTPVVQSPLLHFISIDVGHSPSYHFRDPPKNENQKEIKTAQRQQQTTTNNNKQQQTTTNNIPLITIMTITAITNIREIRLYQIHHQLPTCQIIMVSREKDFEIIDQRLLLSYIPIGWKIDSLTKTLLSNYFVQRHNLSKTIQVLLSKYFRKSDYQFIELFHSFGAFIFNQAKFRLGCMLPKPRSSFKPNNSLSSISSSISNPNNYSIEASSGSPNPNNYSIETRSFYSNDSPIQAQTVRQFINSFLREQSNVSSKI
ncbi:hypothetical protein ACTA71_010212 [Dictyostelium dimigraforme]